MNPVALLLAVWLTAFAGTLLALGRSTPSDEARGRVVLLADESCDAAVVSLDGRFVVLRRVAGDLHPAVDDEVVGPLHLAGVRSFRVPGRGAIAAEVESRPADRSDAARLLGESCTLPALLPRVADQQLMN